MQQAFWNVIFIAAILIEDVVKPTILVAEKQLTG
jgi:hypothetical protein